MKKFKIFLLCFMFSFASCQKNLDNKDTYTVIAPNNQEIKFDKETNLVIKTDKQDDSVKGFDEYSKMLLDSRKILDSSPYKDYKPIYFDPKSEGDYLLFDKWLQLSYKAPKYGSIAPWTNSEKAYYESLKTKRERYIYLVIRSGLISAVIDIPDDAIANVDADGNLINQEYADIYKEVDANVNTLKSAHFSGEYRLSAGMLGNKEAFAGVYTAGFTAREIQALYLAIQLGYTNAINVLKDYYQFYTTDSGLYKSLHKVQELTFLSKSLPYDEFGMLPYADEILGVDWVLDFNRNNYVINPSGSMHRRLKKLIDEGKLLDPRDINSTVESRKEFVDYTNTNLIELMEFFESGFPNDYTQKDIDLYIDSTLLESKVASLIPPQGYPNAPYYFTPEQLKELFHSGKLDKKLNPTIPAIYREHFPEDLREKILKFGRDRGIKD